MLKHNDGFWWSIKIIYKQKDIKNVGKHYCQFCNTDRNFVFRVYYKLEVMGTFFKRILHKEYWLVCEKCERGIKFSKEEMEQMKDFNESQLFSFSERYGWIIFLIIILTLVFIPLIAKSFEVEN